MTNWQCTQVWSVFIAISRQVSGGLVGSRWWHHERGDKQIFYSQRKGEKQHDDTTNDREKERDKERLDKLIKRKEEK